MKPASSSASRIRSGTDASTTSPRLYFLQLRCAASKARKPALDMYSKPRSCRQPVCTCRLHSRLREPVPVAGRLRYPHGP
ncbi:MAG: hypothetical protein MZV64_24310 [Ignavibacteriales bacterium]|nr:hypothetical protein [Ignavibacteriales bacterium]